LAQAIPFLKLCQPSRLEGAGAMAMHRMFVRNTFLELVEEREEPRTSHRASSEPPIRARSPTGSEWELEEATIDSSNTLLGSSGRQDSLKRQQQHLQASMKTAGLKKVMSNESVSTMAPESDDWDSESYNGWDGEDDAARDETAPPQARSLERCIPQARAVGVPVMTSVFSTGSFCNEFTHSSVPKNVNLAEEFAKVSARPLTTMMLRNIPNRYTQHELIEELGVLGFAGSFDFLYAPMDFGTMGNVGYAFINFTSSERAARFRRDLEGFVFAKHQKKSAKKVSTVSVAHLQGLEANLQHYQKSAVTGRGRSKNCGPIVLPRLSQDIETC